MSVIFQAIKGLFEREELTKNQIQVNYAGTEFQVLQTQAEVYGCQNNLVYIGLFGFIGFLVVYHVSESIEDHKQNKKDKELYSLHLYDTCENVLDRLKFYDVDSNPIEEQMSPAKRKRYLREIKADYSYFKSSYERADFQIDIENLPLSDIPDMICRVLAEQQVLPTRT